MAAAFNSEYGLTALVTLLFCFPIVGDTSPYCGNPVSKSYKHNDTNPPVYKVGFLPTIRDRIVGSKKIFLGAVLVAVEDINKGTGPRPYVLQLDTVDVEGDTLKTIQAMTDQYFNGSLAFLGPEDTCADEARIAAAWNLPMIAFNCRDSAVTNNVTNKNKYPTFARTIPSTSKMSKYVISVMKHFGWTVCTLVVGRSPHRLEAAETLRTLAKEYGVTITTGINFTEPYVSRAGIMLPPEIYDIVERTYPNTRIYVFFGDYEALIDFVRNIHTRNLNSRGEYVVLAIQEATRIGDKYFKKFLEYQMEPYMVEAFRSVLLLLPRPPSHKHYETFLNRSRHFSTMPPINAPSIPPDIGKSIPVGIYAAYLYDALQVYARALDEVVDEGGNVCNGSDVVSRIRNRTYTSILGHEMYIDENGDCEDNYTVEALHHDKLVSVGNFRPVDSSFSYIPTFNQERPIDWIGGRVPQSEPKCGFDGSKCRFKPDWPVAVICIVAASLVLIAGVFACRHYLYEQKLASLLWKIDFRDLLMTDSDGDPTSSERLKHKTLGRLRYLSSADSNEDGQATKTFTKVASYKGSLVAVKMVKKRHVEITRAVKKELLLMKEISHDNINRCIGACIEPPNICIVNHYCARGSLEDIFENEDIHLDGMLIASLVSDLIKGMIYIHESEIVSHGALTSRNCLVDSRWVLQVADFGLKQFKCTDTPKPIDDKTLLVTAPELLRLPVPLPAGSQKGDIYSFAFLLYEMHGRCGTWGTTPLSPKEILDRVKFPQEESHIYRPDVSQLNCGDFAIRSMQDCWQNEPELRPDFKYIRVRLNPMEKGLRANIFDNMLAIMEKYATTLEALVEERTKQLMEEKKKTEALLLRMLPKSVADQLKRGVPVIPEHYECVTIYFSDVVGFTLLSAESTPMQVVDLLNDLYTLFDSIIEEYDVYKVETIGDAYMVVSGLPIRNGNNHAGEIASMSLHLLQAINDFRVRHRSQETVKLRIGLHSGPCVAGVVGLKMPRFCLFGDTVNTASRMETTGIPLKIHCSSPCKEILDRLGGYVTEDRGYVPMKGKGEMYTYFITGEDSSYRLGRISVNEPGQCDKKCLRNQLTPVNKRASNSSIASSLQSTGNRDADPLAVECVINGNLVKS